jgi:hypothetical protein
MIRSIFHHPEKAKRALAAQEELARRYQALRSAVTVDTVLTEKRASPDAAGFALGLRLATEHSVEDARAFGEALLRGATAVEAERTGGPVAALQRAGM